MFKKLSQKVKSSIPKVSKAVKKAHNMAKKAVSSIPKAVKAVKSKVSSIAKRVKSSIPKVKNAIKNVNNKVKNAASNAATKVKNGVNKAKEKVNSAVTNLKTKVDKIKEVYDERDKRIAERIKTEILKTSSAIRGSTTQGAIMLPMLPKDRNKILLANFVLQSMKIVQEEDPILSGMINRRKKFVETVKDIRVATYQKVGKWVYDLNLPIISDYVGEFFDVRGEDAGSNFITWRAALSRGFRIDGAVGTIEGVLELLADPIGSAAGITRIAAYPEESIPAIAMEIKKFVNEKVINGTPEDRAALAGQLGFEVFTEIITSGTGKAATTVNAFDTTQDATKFLDEAQDFSKIIDAGQDTTKLLNTAPDTTSFLFNKSEDAMDLAKMDNTNDFLKEILREQIKSQEVG